MVTAIIGTTLILLAIGAGIFVYIGTIAALQFSGQKKTSFFHLSSYITLFTAASLTLFSARNLDTALAGTVLIQETERNPALRILIPLTSIAILFLSIDKVVKFFRVKGHVFGHTSSLTATFVIYWFFSVGSPMLLSSHPYFQHYYIYPLIIGFAALMTGDSERERFVSSTRNALLAFFALGYLLWLLKPSMAADFSYSQGLIPGLPRFAGLAPHSIVLAGLTQITMLTLLLQPFPDRRHNTLAWLICGATFVFAQSKTVWISTFFIGLILYVVRNKDRLQAQLWEERYKGAFIAALAFAMISATAISANLLFGDTSNKLDRFLSSQEGAQITSMTGRDQIWELAIARWQGSPIFGDGAGPSLGLSSATHAHNQLLDTLMHAGLVGGTGLVLYFFALGYYAIKYSTESRGVTLAIFLVIAFRSIGEIPLSVKGYGPEFIAQLLLLVLIASYAGRRSTQANPKPQPIAPRHPCLPSR